ncbi:FAD-binding oxidoreductase [Synechococcus sp. PCC 6312]|uniref:FAD-binding oxidoreductase n=1 Tax=Synechococcus sp. (strain ATCC 27167 / PCC 6312) TaxID=195253 RepID=UPI00029EDF1C|nr:FAD-binding oxidoreductase [Synechococcus sp. PCC 6312]AFY62717.1 FAD/FMN-dependent dehydrogenase [Synechococcus sp. PCC 6312]
MTVISPQSIIDTLGTIVGRESIQAWAEHPAKSIWQRALSPDTHPVAVVYPASVAQIQAIMQAASSQGWRVLPLGSGTKLAWGGLGIADILLSTAHLTQLIDHAAADMTVTAQAGISFQSLQDQLKAEQQFIPLNPIQPDQATLGGIASTRDTGSLRHRYGTIRDLCLGMQFVRADGTLVKSGGRVVKNVAGYDLHKVLIGAWGTLGIITELTLRVYPLPEHSQTWLMGGASDRLAQLLPDLRGNSLMPTCLDLLSPDWLTSTHLQGDLGLRVQFQGFRPAVQVQGKRLKQLAQQAGVQITEIPQPLAGLGAGNLGAGGLRAKFGLLPDQGVLGLNMILAEITKLGLGGSLVFHWGAGIGEMQLLGDEPALAKIVTIIRPLCQARGGFFTVLDAPLALKQSLDLWGYTGNAMALMGTIKQQFDPKGLLSPQRFVGGI